MQKRELVVHKAFFFKNNNSAIIVRPLSRVFDALKSKFDKRCFHQDAKKAPLLSCLQFSNATRDQFAWWEKWENLLAMLKIDGINFAHDRKWDQSKVENFGTGACSPSSEAFPFLFFKDEKALKNFLILLLLLNSAGSAELWKSQKTTTILWWYKLKESLQHNQQISGQSSPSKYMADLGFCSSSICQIQKLDGKRSLDICSQSGLDVCLCFKLLYYLAVSRPFHPFPLIISVHLESSQISW